LIAALLLVAYTLAIAVTVPRLLQGAAWTARAPRLAIAVWQASTASAVGALVFAGLVLAVPASSLSDGLAGLLRSCEMAVRQAYTSAGGIALAGTGLVLAGSVMGRTAWCIISATASAARLRGRHRELLQLVGRPSPQLRATILDSDVAAAYCLPGRSGQVVLTAGALTALSDEQLGAVLAHERAHLSGRHHLVIAGAQGLAQAFPRVPLFRTALGEVRRLVEMLADDAAARDSGRLLVATALVVLADAVSPAAALAAGGPTALSRVRRLLAPANPLSRASTAGGFCLVAVTLVAPVIIAAAPAGAVIGMSWCSPANTGQGAEALAPSGPGGGRAG
jgi:Zn-dependent protease with chaperone function